MHQTGTSKNSSKYILRDDNLTSANDEYDISKEQQVAQEKISTLTLGNYSSTNSKTISVDDQRINKSRNTKIADATPPGRGPPFPPNTKRYWGEEKNFDSIYSIYLKKISYTFNDATLLRSSAMNSPSLDLLPTSPVQNDSNNASCQSRGRKNFFTRKYRRRSCSVDKYSSSSNSNHKILTNETNFKTNSGNSNHHNLGTTSANPNNSISSFSPSQNDSNAQFLQWETRQIRVLQAATLDHVVKFILLINSTNGSDRKSGNNKLSNDASCNLLLEEERNNVAHIIHVLFCTYRIYTYPYKLMLKIFEHSKYCRQEQFKFVMHYWMDNYPEDFMRDSGNSRGLSTIVSSSSSNLGKNSDAKHKSDIATNNEQGNMFGQCSISSCDSSTTILSSTGSNTTAASYSQSSGDEGGGRSSSRNLLRQSSSTSKGNNSLDAGHRTDRIPLIDELLRLQEDDSIRKKAMKIAELNHGLDFDSDDPRSMVVPSTVAKNSSVLDLDSRFVSQQLTAIDLENFLCLRTYSLLEGTKSDKRVQSMIKNFNLLSRHVIITILKSHSPHTVASHWISIAINLRKMKNFNSLKAIIAGLTNESIYRLKQTVWARISRTNMANFKLLSSIVDDVNNQTVLRQTQLIIEGTAKMNVEEDSFGTIPYLGTFLTDLNVIDARYPSFIPSPKEESSKKDSSHTESKLINIEKCVKQFEILTQVQLLQKNVLASLYSVLRKNHFDRHADFSALQMEFNQTQQLLLVKPCIPKVAKVFKTWFHDKDVAAMTDKQCYEISTSLEQNVNTK